MFLSFGPSAIETLNPSTFPHSLSAMIGNLSVDEGLWRQHLSENSKRSLYNHTGNAWPRHHMGCSGRYLKWANLNLEPALLYMCLEPQSSSNQHAMSKVCDQSSSAFAYGLAEHRTHITATMARGCWDPHCSQWPTSQSRLHLRSNPFTERIYSIFIYIQYILGPSRTFQQVTTCDF